MSIGMFSSRIFFEEWHGVSGGVSTWGRAAALVEDDAMGGGGVGSNDRNEWYYYYLYLRIR
jgi:hypothetical protein